VPDTNEKKGLSNASGGEVIIGASGFTEDPQASFGAGNGSGDPNALSFAEDAPGSSSARYRGRRMSIDLQGADIHAVFRFIADTADLNIVASDEVKGTVTVRLKDVPWDQALAAVLQAKGLAAQRFGNIIRVAHIETIKSEQQAEVEKAGLQLGGGCRRAAQDALERARHHPDRSPLQPAHHQGRSCEHRDDS
jgi:type IV pilus assembly protein PilQ